MSLQTFLSKIGDFFSGLFNSAKKTWAKLSPEVQNAMLHGSGIIDIINNNVDKVPSFVIALIQSKYPDITTDKIHAGLKGIADALHIAEGVNDGDLEALISNIQKYLASLNGKIWANISGTLAKAIAAFLAPPETKFAAISSLMEFVYQTFIKKQNG